MKFGWKTRVGLVLSAVWLCLILLAADDYHTLGQLLGVGFLPLIVIWGIVWALSGWRAQRPPKPVVPAEANLEARRKLHLRIRTFIAVVAVLGFGLFAATWQFHASNNEAGGTAIPRWFGEWMVYGLFVYGIFRYVPKTPPGFAAVAASLVIVGGVNYKAHAAISLDREALASLTKAVPLINKIQSSATVTDQEVRDAKVGMLEPLLLAQAAYSREVLAAGESYQQAISGLQPELMLTPTSLASSSIRAQTRAKLTLWQQALAEYKTQLDAATARGRLGVQAAQSQMPTAMAGSLTTGFDEWTAQLNSYVVGFANSERDGGNTVTAILDLMDANPAGYAVDQGPPVRLLFRDEAVLSKYRALMGEMVAASQRETEARARLIHIQSDRTNQLMHLLNR